MTTSSKKEPLMIIDAKAYEKLIYCRDNHDTEIGGWFISESPEKPFHIVDFQTTKQSVTSVTVEFDDADLNRFQSEMMEQEIFPCMCQKIWVHTHPGNSASPSSTDEETFAKMMERVDVGDWMIMFILAKNGSFTCRLSVKTKFGVMNRQLLDKDVEFFVFSNKEWDDEFKKNIHKKVYSSGPKYFHSNTNGHWKGPQNYPTSWNRNGSNYETKKEGGGLILPPITTNNSLQWKDKESINSYTLAGILHHYRVDRVQELKPKQIKKIFKRYGVTLTELRKLESALYMDENDHIDTTYRKILLRNNVDSVYDIPHDKWDDIVKDEFIRKFRYFEYEDSLNEATGVIEGEDLEKIACEALFEEDEESNDPAFRNMFDL